MTVERPPIIRTDRLTLRGHRVDDHTSSSAMWADAKVVRYISGKPSSAQQSWMRVLNYAGHWTLLGFGYWVIEQSATQKFVGEVGFADFKRGLHPSLSKLPEIGWALAADMQGQGFATEAVRAAVAWSDGHFDENETICIIDPANVASLRVANKCGYQEARRIVQNEKQMVLLRRTKRHGVIEHAHR